MADDVILIEYKAKLTDLENKLSQLEKDLRGVESSSKKSMGGLEQGGKKAADSVKKVDKEVSGLGSKLNDLAGRIPGVFAVQEVLGYGKAIQGASAATSGMTGAMKLLKVAVIGSGIGALAIALIALISYFKRTDEGATKLEGIMGALGAATDEVTGFVAELGSTIFKAFESVANFKEGLSDLGEFLVNNLFNRFKAFLVFGEAFGKFFKGDFSGALKTGYDALFQLGTGVENITDKASAFAERLAKAAKEAYDFALSMDAINDAQRDLNVRISANNILIVEAIKQSKNHSLSLDERRDKLLFANKLEAQGLNEQLVLENKKLALLKERNKLQSDSINQKLNEDIKAAKSDKEIFELRKKQLSINDDQAQEVAAQQIKINELKLSSVALTEKNNNSLAALDELAIQEKVDAEKKKAIQLEDIEKERFLKSEINAQELAATIEQIDIDSLERQKAILISFGKDTTDVDKAIIDIKLKRKGEEIKSLEDSDKDYAEKAKEAADKAAAERAERDKKEIEADKKKQALKMQILNDAVATAQNFANKEIQRSFEKKQAIINSEIAANQKQTDTQSANIDKLLEKGLISEEQAASRKETLAKKSAKKDYELKKKAFESQKKADEETAAINMAVAIIKSLATYGFTPAGVIAAAAAAAEGAIEIGFISSRKYPAFKDGVVGFKGKGTGTSDENHVMISNDESVITAKGTRKHRGLLEAVNEDRVEKYLTTDYLKPILAKQQRVHDREKRLLEGALVQAIANGNDNSHMERLIKNNKTVNLGNAEQIGKAVAKEMKSGNSPRMK